MNGLKFMFVKSPFNITKNGTSLIFNPVRGKVSTNCESSNLSFEIIEDLYKIYKNKTLEFMKTTGESIIRYKSYPLKCENQEITSMLLNVTFVLLVIIGGLVFIVSYFLVINQIKKIFFLQIKKYFTGNSKKYFML